MANSEFARNPTAIRHSPLPDSAALKNATFGVKSARFDARTWPCGAPMPPRPPTQPDERQTLPRFALVPISRRLCRAALFFAAAAVLSAPAAARQPVAVAAPFEVGESQAGNYLAALIAGADRDTVAASTFFREALRGDPRNVELTERAFLAALSNGNMPDAFSLAERLTARKSDGGLAHLALGVRALKQKQYVTARGHFAKGGAGRARDVTAILLTAWSWVGSGEIKKALESIDRLNENNVTLFRNYHAGLIADVLNNAPEATVRLKAAYAADPETLRLVDAYGRFLSKRGNKDEAKKVYEAFDRVLPRHPIITAALADLNAGRALEPFVRNAQSGAAEVLYGLGAAGGRQGDELAAIIYLRLSLYLQQDNGLALMTLGDIYDRVKQSESAIDAYEEIPETSPLRASADIQTGLTLEALGQQDKAAKHLEDIVAERPKDIEAHSALANLQSSRKKFAEAETALDAAIALVDKPDGGHWSLYYRRGIARERLKTWPGAEADFKKALELYPEQPQVLNYLGYSWVDMGVNLDEGLKMLRRAVELRPNDGYIVDSLGWAYYRLGNYEEAMKQLERAIDLKASDPVINDHLGDTYWRVGRKLEAQFQWNHARDLKPEPEDLVKILKKIDKGLDEQEKPASADTGVKKDPG